MKYLFFFPLVLLFAACGGIAAPQEYGGTASPDAAGQSAAQGEAAPSQTERMNLPEAVGFVNDFADIYSDEEEASLEQLIKQHEKASSNQIAIVTIPSIGDYISLESYSLDLFNKWGVGQEDQDNGVGLAIAPNLRQTRIQVGYGLENKLTDQEAKGIIDGKMMSEFAKGNFYEGSKKALLEIINEIR